MDKCELITGMIDAINERGWCQNQLEDNKGRVCIRGAMNVVLTNDPTKFRLLDTGEIRRETEDAMKEFIPGQYRDESSWRYDNTVITFNNAEDTTKEDVLDVLQKTKEKVC